MAFRSTNACLSAAQAFTCCVAALLLAGCTTTTDRGSWGSHGHWPSAGEFGRAAVSAAKDPHTWAPLAGAVVIGITGLDDDLSEWAVDHQPVFGSDARDASDTLRDLSTIAYGATALLAPRPAFSDKLKGVAVGIGTVALTQGISRGTKEIVDRERPDGRDKLSFPSGHASTTSARATLAAANLDYMPLPRWANVGLKVGFYGIAGGAAWARVEAEQHHVTDVLVGYALGHFVARFMHVAFLEAGNDNVSINFVPHPDGGALRVSYGLGGAD